METTPPRSPARFWVSMGAAFTAGMLVGAVLGVCGVVVMAHVLAARISLP